MICVIRRYFEKKRRIIMSIEVGSRLKEIRQKLMTTRQQWGEKLGLKLEHRHLIEKDLKKRSRGFPQFTISKCRLGDRDQKPLSNGK
jgi:hypothetical protein